MALPPVDPGTGLPNINPAYFPAFAMTWVTPPSGGFPPVGSGMFQTGPVVVPIQRLPTVRVPPFTIGPAPTPPPAPTTFATWDDVVTGINENGIQTGDQVVVQANGALPLGVWVYNGPPVDVTAVPPDEYTFNAADWSQALAPLHAGIAPMSASAEAPPPKGRKRK